MRLMSRADWGAAPANSVSKVATPVAELWLHHEGGESDGAAGVRAIQQYHLQTGYSDIAYNFLVDDDGTVYEGRGAGVQSGATYGHNSNSASISAMGNYETRPPSDVMVNAIAELVRYGGQQGWWPGALTGGHRDAGAQTDPPYGTACPGQFLYGRIGDINRLATSAPAPAPAPVQAWAAVITTDADFEATRQTLHLKLGMAIYNPADAQARRLPLVVYVGAADVPAKPWLYHRRAIQATGNGIQETRALLDWIVKVGLP